MPSSYVQYRYKGRFVTPEKAEKLSRTKSGLTKLTSEIKSTPTGKAELSSKGFKGRIELKTELAIQRDRIAREEAIQRKRESEEKSRQREVQKRIEFEREQAYGPEPAAGPSYHYTERDIPADLGYDRLRYEDDLFDDLLDYWEVADLDDEEYGEAES